METTAPAQPVWWREVSTDIWTLDFYCPFARLAVEVDGGYHCRYRDRDEHRDRDNAFHGVRTLRFSNEDVARRLRHVLRTIDRVTDERTATKVRHSWRGRRRADEVRRDNDPVEGLRHMRKAKPRRPPPTRPTGGPDPALQLLERVRYRWGRAHNS
jgi:hypothetical protein